ncbi:hypothetical protein SDC9_199568 [bioreactor metagenome]|uniref:Uncharacterized protein n=1 Tax=bioreactor metagenome TaxID=1076179 RepID=A0A645IKX1_9ZZZZ
MITQSQIDNIVFSQGFQKIPSLDIIAIDLVETVTLLQSLEICIYRIDGYFPAAGSEGVTDFFCRNGTSYATS